jgi:membrane associated rhomboid family serine protease
VDQGSPSETFPLTGRIGLVALDERGVHHPRSSRGGGMTFTPYDEIVHLAASARSLWIGARRSVYVLARSSFVSEHAPDRLVRALLERIAALPDGAARLERMAAMEERGREPSPTPATWGLAGACLVVFALQLLVGDAVYDVGFYSAPLVDGGDWWRLITANLLHGYPRVPIHLGLNLLGLIALGTLIERPLGPVRTLLVMGASGLAAMFASGLAGYPEVVGVSGVVFGLLGAITWLELRHGAELPAWWRVPRRALFVMLGLSVVLGVMVPVIAGAAHLGGLLAGGAVAALCWRPGARGASPWMRVAAGAVVGVTALAVVAAAADLGQPDEYPARLARRMAELPGISPLVLNNRAWTIAVDPDSSPELLSAALLMAERAVDETDREEATVLDTLAEIQFQLGRDAEAVATIEEAILRDPDERYYQEQRRRFLGERARDDRPPSPGFPEPEPEEEPAGISV